MVVSYEMFLRCLDDVKLTSFDLLVCDEAHRLKNANSKAVSAINELMIERCVFLTGTPIQNDLQEFYTLANLANPGILGSLSAFRRKYEEPITAIQQPDCSVEQLEAGRECIEELVELTSSFCLRRTSEVNKQFLPS